MYDTLVPGYAGRCTAPLLTDGRRRAPVSNDSGEICRLFNDGFPQSRVDLRPEALRPSIDALNERIYTDVSNAVYQSGFATTQAAYDRCVACAILQKAVHLACRPQSSTHALAGY